jgi:CheY-like chemotaxis protein
MDGYAATKAIRALDRRDAKTVPIIAMSADAYSDDVKHCLEVGMNDHVSKPIDEALLCDAIRREMGEVS